MALRCIATWRVLKTWDVAPVDQCFNYEVRNAPTYKLNTFIQFQHHFPTVFRGNILWSNSQVEGIDLITFGEVIGLLLAFRMCVLHLDMSLPFESKAPQAKIRQNFALFHHSVKIREGWAKWLSHNEVQSSGLKVTKMRQSDRCRKSRPIFALSVWLLQKIMGDVGETTEWILRVYLKIKLAIYFWWGVSRPSDSLGVEKDEAKHTCKGLPTQVGRPHLI